MTMSIWPLPGAFLLGYFHLGSLVNCGGRHFLISVCRLRRNHIPKYSIRNQKVFRVMLRIAHKNLKPSRSFGACSRSCWVPKYFSVVEMEACPSSSCTCSSSPPALRQSLAHVR